MVTSVAGSELVAILSATHRGQTFKNIRFVDVGHAVAFGLCVHFGNEKFWRCLWLGRAVYIVI
jgi:hypothetical protein